MENHLAIRKEEALVTNEQLSILKNTIAKDATPAELQLFIYDCQRQGVHPLDRMIHFTKRGGKYTPVSSIDFFRARADESGEYAGNDEPVFEASGNSNPLKASVTVYRIVGGERCAFTATARWSEYFPGEAQGFMWKKMPFLMLGKCAEALALRKAFPKQLSGIYTKEEMDQAGPVDVKPNLHIPIIKSAKISDTHKNEVQNDISDVPYYDSDISQEAQEVFEGSTVIEKSEPPLPPKAKKPIEEKIEKKKGSQKPPSLRVSQDQIDVLDSYSIKEQLKVMGYRWNAAGSCWSIAFSETNLNEVCELIGANPRDYLA